MIEYVDLKRNFIPVAKHSEPNLAIGRAWGRKLGGWLEWSDLLDHQRVVLLAEASSGKSAEFKHTAAGLRSNGAFAFYSTIEQLAAGQLGLGQAEQELLERWKSGAERAWFFLDSVDEARLNQKKFDDALRNFTAQIGPAFGRASVLISCRASDWKGKSDYATILEFLPLPQIAPAAAPPETPDAALLDPIFNRAKRDSAKSKSEKEKQDKPDVLVVQLIPLSDDQRRLLAQTSGITDAEPFIAAIELQGLDVLAERPGDVLELAQYWAQKRKFGSLSAMTEHSVVTKLTEPDRYRPDNSALPLAKARQGAERLAAALTLGKSSTLLAAGQEPDPTLAAGGLDPAVLLDDWTVAEVNALLRRGIFAPSTYGRIRFHHRSTQEYLAGKWLSGLLAQGCPRSAIFDLLFSERYGVATVVPSLRSAAAWLALDHADIRDEVIRREPMLLMTHGDPAALPSDVKAHLLLHLAMRHVAGDISDDSIDRRAMWMFASPDLADAIRAAWKINDRPEFRGDLIRLIREGKIIGCIDLAAAVAKSEMARDYDRIVGLQALIACDATAEISAVTQLLLHKPSGASPRLASGFAEVLFPKFISASQLLTLIEKSQPPRSHAVEGFAYSVDNLWKACPVDQRSDLIAGLARLSLQQPFVQEYNRVSRRHAELAKKLGHIAHDTLLALGNADAPPASLVNLLSVVERAERPSGEPDDKPPLNELVQQHAKVQRELFWHDVAEARQHSRNPVVTTWDIHFGGQTLWGLGRADLTWLRDDVKSRTEEDDRRVALSAIVQILRDELKENADSLRKLVGKNAALEKDLIGYLAPPKKSAMARRHEQRSAKLNSERARQEIKDKKAWQDFRTKLAKDPSKLSNPSFVATNLGLSFLRNLCEWLHRKTGKELPEAILEWKLLEPAFSPEIAINFRDGMKALWRLTPPERPTRTPGGPTTTKWTTILSFAAIGIEATDDPAFANRLSQDEAERAALHACLSEQGYPAWIETLIAAHPAVVVPVVREAFLSEWTAPENAGSYMIYRYAQSAIQIASAIQGGLLDIILSSDPLSLQTLERGLDIVRNFALTKEQRANVRRFAVAKFKEHSTAKPNWALRYIALLFLVDVPEAAKVLLAWLKTLKSRKHGDLVLKALGTLFGTNHPIAATSLEEAPLAAIVELILFSYQTVRPENDVIHEGMYQPNERDDAEGARGAFLKTLADRPGQAAYEAMLKLSRHRDLCPAGFVSVN